MPDSEMIWCVANKGFDKSFFFDTHFPLEGDRYRSISPRVDALNFRFRRSSADYSSDWHVAGDPTLIVITAGAVAIILRDGTQKVFKAGSYFIAQDFLNNGVSFDASRHGHRAQVVGEKGFKAVHIKLANRMLY